MVLKHVDIGYDPDKTPLLADISFEIPLGGMKLCCSGEPNGAEKSTLLKALPGNVPEMILRGEDTYNEQLRLGVFTPDGWWIW